MIKNIIIGILLLIVGVLILAGFETLQNFHKAQDYINALEKDFNSALKKYKDDKNKLINYLLRKGYSYDEINTKLKNLV